MDVRPILARSSTLKKAVAEFPLQITVKRSSTQGQTESLRCTALLREIPGKRRVYDAQWADRNVIVKVFSDKLKAAHHLKKERQGLTTLAERGLNGPQPLLQGRTENGDRVLVIEKICNAPTALDIFHSKTEKSEQLSILLSICRDMAEQHAKGVMQRDLHLGNMLVTDDKIVALDAGQMKFYSQPVGKKDSIAQLASLARYLPADDADSALKLCREYYRVRDQAPTEADEALFHKELVRQRMKSIQRGLKKSLRTGKRNLLIRMGEYIAVFDRDFCERAEPADLVGNIDALMDGGHILKRGNTCYVSRLTWNDRDIVIKRYNHKGFVHSLRHTIKGSRARRAWLQGQRLRMLDIPTPKPQAYIEQRKKGLLWKSYIVTDYVAGPNLHDFLQDADTTAEQRSVTAEQLGSILDRLCTYKISHGDLKPSNILVAAHGPAIIDLDAITIHTSKRICKRNMRRARNLYSSLSEAL